MAYDGSERECFYVAEDTLANQNFQYVTGASFADEERDIAALATLFSKAYTVNVSLRYLPRFKSVLLKTGK